MFGLGKYSSGGRLVVLVRRGACDMGPNLGHVHVRANRRRGDWHGGLWMLLLGGLPGQSQKPDAGGSLPRTDRPHHRAMVIHGCSVDGASLNGRNLSFRSGNDQSRSASVTWPCNARSVEMPSHAPAYLASRRSLMPVVLCHGLIDLTIEPWLFMVAVSMARSI